MKTIRINRKSYPKALLGVIGILLFFYGTIFGFTNTKFIAIYVLFLSIYLTWWCRKNSMLFISMAVLTYSNYSIAFSEYVVIKQNTLFTRYAGTEAAQIGIYIMLLFWSVMIFSFPQKIPRFSSHDYHEYWRYKNKNIVQFVYTIILNAVLVFILIFGFKRPSSLGVRGTPSAIYEYSIILLILCYYFGGNFTSLRISTTIILFLFAIQNFIYGGRITGLQVLIVFYLMYIEEKYSLRSIIPFVICLFLLLIIIGTYRANWYSSGFDLSSITKSMSENLFTIDTAYSSYHTSLTFILFMQETNYQVRFQVFWNFIKSIFMGGYGTASNSVAHLTANYYAHYNGGVLPFFFYFYFGWIGVTVIGIYVSTVIKYLLRQTHRLAELKKCLLLYLVVSSARWYLYSPIQLTRGLLLMGLAFGLSDKFIKTIEKNNMAAESPNNI